jgi:predicted ribosome quality control (RQC) complex YloA/Tae2 family protein
LNWKEIELLSAIFRPEIEGLFVDRIIVPSRERFPGGYLKGEWVIRLTGRHCDGSFLFSVRTRCPYFAFLPGKGSRAASAATRSAFDLELTKRLKGAKLKKFETIHKERTIILWFSNPSLGLVLNLIPATPEALLVQGEPGLANYPIIIRSRTGREAQTQFTPPDGSKAPNAPSVREGLSHYARNLERALDLEAFAARLVVAQRELRDLVKQCRERIRQTQTALHEASADQDWRRYGELLKAYLHENPAIEAHGKHWVRRVKSFDTKENRSEKDASDWIELPADPKLGASEQVEKYYTLAKRRDRRIIEATLRLESLQEVLTRVENLLANEPPLGDFKELEKLERAAGSTAGQGAAPTTEKKGKKGAWLGKTFTSKEGLTIFVGRSRDENLELTFKHARGNDVWMHVRGRPGAHVVIPLQPGKSAPLETLLDAAVLAIYYSGGESWGKTEVDYTFKKYVKRIKDSSEASYVNNRTLITEPDKARIKRLISRTD